MNKIIDFNNYKTNLDEDIITLEDIFNLFLIFKQKEEIFVKFDINVLMQSLAKYRNLEKFNLIFKNILVENDEFDNEIINLSPFLEKKQQEKLIIQNPKSKNEIHILGTEDIFEKLTSNYSKKVLFIFNELMFFINNDLKFGIDNWEILLEDEIINVPGYPSIVTAEFIGKNKKNPSVKKKMKERTIERIFNK